MDDILKLLSGYLISNHSNEDVLFRIFEFLKDKIPFERIGCHYINRKTKLLTTFVEYSYEERMPAYSYYIDEMRSADDIGNILAKDKNLVLGNLNSKDPIPYIKALPYKVKSFMIFSFNFPKDVSSNYVLGCYSTQENAFDLTHYELLASVRVFLEKLILDLYAVNAKPHIFLASVGQLPSTYEEQLRACPGMVKVMKRVDAVSKFDLSVFINGATGTGKELVAETIHALSFRRNLPFVRVNCGAIAEQLLESELFGFEKGSFTGANTMRRGYFEQANGGTIYLDEIADLSKSAQVSLLRVLEDRTVRRIGSENPIKLDIRIITATHKNLWEMVKKGEFREDLYYRINIFPIEIPPLMQRREDIKILLDYYYQISIKKFKLENPPIISNETFKKIINYEWPGNVRQLKAALERGIIEAIADNKTEINFNFLPNLSIHEYGKKNFTREEIVDALEQCKGKIQGPNGAAEFLGIHPATLRSRMTVLDIEYKKNKIKERVK